MVLLDTATVVVRANTARLGADFSRGMRDSQRSVQRSGETMGQAFTRGFERGTDINVFRRFANGLRTMTPGIESARAAMAGLIRTGYSVGTALSSALGGISSIIGGLGALAGAAGAAAASLAVVGNAVFALGAGMIASKLALSGVGSALNKLQNPTGGGGGGGGSTGGGGGGSAPQPEDPAIAAAALERIQDAELALSRVLQRNREALLDANEDVRKAQLALNAALREGREEIQQLGFDAEDAALSEKKAALELEDARVALARAQDLPPNDRVRQEAELAYQQAELNYRRTKDSASDLAAEQDRLARTGTRGTQSAIAAAEALAEAEDRKSDIIRDGLESQADAEDALGDAKRDAARKAAAAESAGSGGGGSSGGGGGGGSDWAEGLNEAQKNFVLFLNSLKPKFDELERIAAESFLPKLQEAIENLMTYAYPVVAVGIGQVAGAMGDAAKELSFAMTQRTNLDSLARAFESAAAILPGFGRILGDMWGSALSIISGADQLTRRFVGWLETKMGLFADFLDTKEANGELENFFNRAGDEMAKFGKIFGNIFGGLGAIIQANFGPGTGGGYLLDWIIQATAKFNDLDSNAMKAQGLKQYFLDVSINAQKVLSSVGELIGVLIDAGRNPAIGQMFDILGGGAGFVGNILEKSIEAGPVLAELVVELTRFVDLMTDTGAIEIFFGILRDALKIINALMQNEVIAGFLIFSGQISAVALAFGAILGPIKFFGKAIVGAVALGSNALGLLAGLGGGTGFGAVNGAMQGVIAKGGTMGKVLGGLSSAMGGPYAIAAVALTTAVLGIVEVIKGAEAPIEELQRALKGTADGQVIMSKALDTSSTGIERWLAGFVTSSATITDTNDIVKNLGGTLIEVGKHNDNFWTRWQQGGDELILLDALKTMGEEFGTLASTDLPQAQKAFQNFASQNKLSNDQLLTAIHEMPEFKQALADQAQQLGVNIRDTNSLAGEQDLLNFAMGETNIPIQEQAELLADMQGKAFDAEGSISNLASTIRDFASGQLDVNAANRDFQQAIRDNTAAIDIQRQAQLEANGTLEGWRASINPATEEGAKNQAMLDEMASSTLNLAASTYEQTGSQAGATEAILTGRNALIEQMKQMGYTEDEAKAYADQLGLIPENIKTVMEADVNHANSVFQGFVNRWDGTTLRVNMEGNTPVYTTPSGQKFSYMGNLFENHVAQAFATGGFGGGGGSGMFSDSRGPLYKFAEPGTQWEAFISGKPGYEERNGKILNEAARRLGMSASNSAPNVTVNVYATPGMDVQAIAQEVSSLISFNMRKGGFS